MDKPTGRHRKPLRGWGKRTRWLLGAVLTAVLCSPIQVPRDRAGAGPGAVARPVLGGIAIPHAKPGPEPLPGPVPIPRPRLPHPSKQGWCVDDDGVRGVRPYLFAAPKRIRASRHAIGEPPGEFDDLAGLVRAWLDLAT